MLKVILEVGQRAGKLGRFSKTLTVWIDRRKPFLTVS
jgi:hypothetical protein